MNTLDDLFVFQKAYMSKSVLQSDQKQLDVPWLSIEAHDAHAPHLRVDEKALENNTCRGQTTPLYIFCTRPSKCAWCTLE